MDTAKSWMGLSLHQKAVVEKTIPLAKAFDAARDVGPFGKMFPDIIFKVHDH